MKKNISKKERQKDILVRALDFHQKHMFSEAAVLYEEALLIDAGNFDALSLFGALLLQTKKLPQALKMLSKANKINSSDPICHNNQGICLKELGRYEEALISYDCAVRLNPKYFEAIFNRGNTLWQLKRYDEAIKSYDQSLKINPAYRDAILNRSNLFGELSRFDEAIKGFELILSQHPEHEGASIGLAQVLKRIRQFEDATEVVKKLPNYHLSSLALTCLGDISRDQNNFSESIVNYDLAIKVDPNNSIAWFGKSQALSGVNLSKESIECYIKAIELEKDGRFKSSLCLFVFEKLKIARWDVFSSDLHSLLKAQDGGEINPLPFVYLALFDESSIQHQAALSYAKEILLGVNSVWRPQVRTHQKIRLAYFSADFRSHPVGFLLAELFELHNRDLFELVAFSYKKAPADDVVHTRIINGFDFFIDAQNKSDVDIIKIARELEIDIAVDLGGYTEGSRPTIFASRVAQIQLNYFGFAGTSGAKYMDYIIADHIVIPPENQIFFSEKIAYLPNSYMVDDSRRLPSDKTFARSDFGLPENKFIFCCFNNGYKFNPQILEAWSKILLNSPNSIIWLTENNAEFANNVLREFSELGISSERVIFAKRLESMADHLARYRLVDLFLDTHPYNAHTTALDALKMGVPVLTYCGKTFAGRVAASLLTCLDLTELVVDSLEQYVSLATKLSLSSEELEGVKHKLAENLKIKPLFDTRSYVNNLEILYLEMYRRYLSGLPPETFSYGDIKLA